MGKEQAGTEEFIVRDKRTANYFVIDNAWLDVYGPIVRSPGIAVYAALLRFSNANGRGAWPCIATVARLTGCSISTVKRYLRLLEEYGLIGITPRHWSDGGQQSNEYAILEPPTEPRRTIKKRTPTDSIRRKALPPEEPEEPANTGPLVEGVTVNGGEVHSERGGEFTVNGGGGHNELRSIPLDQSPIDQEERKSAAIAPHAPDPEPSCSSPTPKTEDPDKEADKMALFFGLRASEKGAAIAAPVVIAPPTGRTGEPIWVELWRICLSGAYPLQHGLSLDGLLDWAQEFSRLYTVVPPSRKASDIRGWANAAQDCIAPFAEDIEEHGGDKKDLIRRAMCGLQIAHWLAETKRDFGFTVLAPYSLKKAMRQMAGVVRELGGDGLPGREDLMRKYPVHKAGNTWAKAAPAKPQPPFSAADMEAARRVWQMRAQAAKLEPEG